MRQKIIIGLILLPLLSLAHKFYVSLAEVHRKPQGLELSARMFTDDFENALQKAYATQLKIEDAGMDSLVAHYLQQRLKFWVGDSLLQPHFVGKEVMMDLTWIYVEFPFAENIKTLKVQNLLLLDSFEEQSNITHIKDRKGYLESHMFNSDRKTHIFEMNE